MRPSPWIQGWGKRDAAPSDHKFPTMMRSRTDHRGDICASNWQYHPNDLLHTDHHPLSNLPVRDWFRKIRESSTDQDMLAGLGHITLGQVTRDNEHDALRAVHWITENTKSNGFRIPSGVERANAFGMGKYLTDMTKAGWLSEKDLFDATGNMFDKDALLSRIGDVVLDWISGSNIVQRHSFLHPTFIAEAYAALRSPIAAMFSDVPSSHLPNEYTVEDLEKIEATFAPPPWPQPALKRRRGNGTGGSAGIKNVDRCLHPELTRLGFTIGEAGSWQLPASWGHPVIGRAGYITEAVQQELCVPDAIQQLLLGTPRANGNPDILGSIQKMHREITE
jgi:hypothetical protein